MNEKNQKDVDYVKISIYEYEDLKRAKYDKEVYDEIFQYFLDNFERYLFKGEL
jgi:hypothetical protein